MPDVPRLSYHVYHPETPSSPHLNHWQKRLPLSRKMTEDNLSAADLTYGDYFRAARSFFERDGYKKLCLALSERLGQSIEAGDLREIRIVLEKHGEYYHPSRVSAMAREQKISFVLNIAISESGNRYIEDEYHNLKKLNDEFDVSFLPRVYFFGAIGFRRKLKLQMFLGDWFEGYHEFHHSKDPSDHQYKISVWDDERGHFFLSPEQTSALYTRAAVIMSYYYNLQTFEHISAWHHAGGDFVVKLDRGGLDVKLISVRRYVPLFQDIDDRGHSAKSAETVLQALLIFFLNLSIKMRLDRLDGVGDLIWSDPCTVHSVVTGVLEGLDQKRAVASLSGSISSCFKTYLSVCTFEDLLDLSKFLVSAYQLPKPEIALIKKNLSEHVQSVYRALNQI